ncbi:NAD(P)/FAD-dependent oxidoreductase [Cohnella thailandensis]|uniref:FAD-dependent oxidoreductase n=1 Tax=Cohnella thailandensis TaxID=557557 RepID=A0A841SVD5_9BACL|nr:FAD-dependent oxidoreductase [Cohnella thailandensis]MBB6634949.1 FAD-dependent oxidoreductase [Cohnella thailandensis]MBP1975829.1 3-phenylpropionate/trans-cinnamate dioxygenase ferredoxin reductase subunit [Cohnella thailandensis]
MLEKKIVIVGAGEAGTRAAIELREQGWEGELTLVGDEPLHPYERPPLSKQQLSEEELPLPATILNAERMKELAIDFAAGDAAVRINREHKRVVLASGKELAYGKLLLATGSNPRMLAVPGDASGEMLYLRKHADAIAIRDCLRPGSRLAVIGGGFIGLEVAAGAIRRGCEATLIEVGPRILMRGVPEPIAAAVEARHREAGVRFHVGVGIASANRADGGYAIELADGTTVRADVIVAGIGAIPETALAEASGLAIENGIRVNERLQTSDPDIYAIGDCCSFPHPLFGGRRIRLESWRNAQDQGTHVATGLLGASEPYRSLPWFWSDQYELTLQVAGLSDPSDRIVLRDLGETGRIYFHLAGDGRLVCASGIGPSDGAIAREMKLAERLTERQPVIPAEELADPSRKLKDLLRAQPV